MQGIGAAWLYPIMRPWRAPLGGLVGAPAVVAGLLFVDEVGAGASAGLTITANTLMSRRAGHCRPRIWPAGRSGSKFPRVAKLSRHAIGEP